MDYIEEIIEEKKIIISRVKGDLYPEETAEMGLKIRKKAIELGYKVIIDFRETKNYVSIVQGHNWFADFYDNIDKNIKYVPTAHITNDEEESYFKFIETSWSNKGASIKLFKDIEAAVKWLDSLEI